MAHHLRSFDALIPPIRDRSKISVHERETMVHASVMKVMRRAGPVSRKIPNFLIASPIVT